MAINKLLLIGGTTLAVGLATVAGAGVVSAQSTTSTGSTSIVDKIAQKFNLNKADVQKVFDEDRATHEAERKAELKTKLDQLVKDGKLTADQENKLIAKLNERDAARDANRTAMQSKTEAERKAAMDKERSEFDAWLKTNNISTDIMQQIGGRGMGGPEGHRGGGMMGESLAPSTTN